MLKIKFVLGIFILGLSACNYKVDKAANQLDNIPNFSKEEISFSLLKEYVFGPKCIACHQAQGQLDLSDYGKSFINRSTIEQSALIKFSMPKSPEAPLSEGEKRVLRLWLDAGAPQNAGSVGAEPPPPVPLEAKFESIKKVIFERKCTQCHNPNGKAHDVPLETIADLTDGFEPLVIAGDVDGSLLVQTIIPGAKKPMPPIKTGITLTDEEIATIKEWIKNGAKD